MGVWKFCFRPWKIRRSGITWHWNCSFPVRRTLVRNRLHSKRDWAKLSKVSFGMWNLLVKLEKELFSFQLGMHLNNILWDSYTTLFDMTTFLQSTKSSIKLGNCFCSIYTRDKVRIAMTVCLNRLGLRCDGDVSRGNVKAHHPRWRGLRCARISSLGISFVIMCKVQQEWGLLFRYFDIFNLGSIRSTCAGFSADVGCSGTGRSGMHEKPLFLDNPCF